MINELNSSGAVHLETLDGEQMANFINGSRVRLYNEPLTQEMMNRMDTAVSAHGKIDSLMKTRSKGREEEERSKCRNGHTAKQAV